MRVARFRLLLCKGGKGGGGVHTSDAQETQKSVGHDHHIGHSTRPDDDHLDYSHSQEEVYDNGNKVESEANVEEIQGLAFKEVEELEEDFNDGGQP